MKKIRKIFAALFLTVILMEGLCVSAIAAPVEHDGIEISIVNDKESYEINEDINSVITITNTNEETVRIEDLEQIVPEGYRVKETSRDELREVELLPGETITLNVTFENITDPAEEETEQNFFDKLIFGETFGIPNVLMAFLAIIAIGLFYYFT